MTVASESDSELQLRLDHNMIDCGSGIYAMPYYLRETHSGRIKRSGYWLWHPRPKQDTYCRTVLRGRPLSTDPFAWADVLACPHCGLRGKIIDGKWQPVKPS